MAKARILIVEDSTDLAQGIRYRLDQLGYEVVAIFASGEEAVRRVGELRPSLVLMDIGLPGEIDGVEAAARIRANHDVPVIYLTAYSDDRTLQRAKVTEPFGYLLKPFQDGELRSVVEMALYKHQVDKELRRSTERFQFYYEKAPLGYQSLDKHGCLAGVNPAWLDMLGYSRQEVIGRLFTDFVQQGDLFKEWLSHFKTSGEMQGAEFGMVRKDGLVVPVSIEGRISYDRDGNVQQTHFILHDITERMRAEEALRQRNRELALLNRAAQAINSTLELDQVLAAVLTAARHLLGVTACSVWLLDPETGDLVCWQAAAPHGDLVRDWRLAPGEGIAGWTVRSGESLMVPDAQADERYFPGVDEQSGLKTRSLLSVPLQTKESVIGVLEVMDERLALFGPADLILTESLAALAVTAIQNAELYGQAQREIAERKQAQEALKQHAARLALLNEIGEKVAAAFDLDSVLDRSARLVQEGFGYQHVALFTLDREQGELLMRAKAGDYAHIFPDGHRLKLGQGMVGWVGSHNETLLTNNVAFEPRHLNFFPDLLPTQAELSVPIRAGGELVGVIDAQSIYLDAFDASDAVVMEALAGQIGAAVENMRLAGDAAEVEILRELDRLRGELIANVSHELRTPLGLIKIFCTTLLRDDMELALETQREFLRDIDDETDKLEQIVDNLLDLSRIGAGRLRLDKQVTGLGQLARQVMDAMKVHSQRHRLIFDFPDEPILAFVDPKRVEQVLRNLLGNAIKYSPDGGEIAVHGHWDGKHFALIWVNDQGIGIPEEDLERVFERFYRVESGTTVRGAGLGLAVCRSLVEAHGGQIWAESTLGAGSTFYFTLPVEDEVDREK